MRVLLAIAFVAALMRPAPASEAPPWDQLDWRIDRGLLVSRYLFHDVQPDDPWEAYAATLGADAIPLRDLLAEFDALDAADRRRAREAAADLLWRGKRVVLVRALELRDVTRANKRLPVGDFSEPTPGFAEAVTRAIDRLAAAVRRDPTLAEAWYHLAYFSGLAGDRRRAARAHEAFMTVWPRQDQDTRDRLAAMYQLVVLDRAWALRESGQGDACLAWLDRHRDRLDTRTDGPGIAPADEARLIAALVHAERGEATPARALIAHLPRVELPHRANAPLEAYVSVGNQRARYYERFLYGGNPLHKLDPEPDVSQADKMVRERRTSSYLRRWVKAWLSHGRGHDAETVRRELGRIELEVDFQPRLAWRWWQDQGVLYEQLGDYQLAEVCWARAAVYRPYFIYHPMGQGRGIPRVHGLAGTGRPYFLAYGTYFMTGSPWSYAANVALASETEEKALERTTLRRLAREHLDACVRRGLQAASARALRGRLSFLEEDYAAAEAELTAAWTALTAEDRAPAELALMIGLCHFNRSDWPMARPWLRTFTDRSADAPVGWLARGLTQAMLGHDEDAFASLDRAVALAPDDATALYNRGLLHYRLRRHDEARRDFLAARELWPENPQIAQMVEVTAEQVHYDLQMAAAPIHAGLPPEQREELARLRARRTEAGLADELGDLVASDAAALRDQVSALERRYDDQPTPARRQRLAQALFLADRLDRVETLLAPVWPERLSPIERRLLLYADRDRGRAARAGEVAATTWAADLDDLDLVVLAATILLEHGRGDEAARLVARGLEQAPDSLALQELQRAVGGER
ncbi:tetratricopeptide repeat protein [bacterium]|nr:tetratricopeptide repeat protein [bacterium]